MISIFKSRSDNNNNNANVANRSNYNNNTLASIESRRKYIILPLSAGLSGVVEACSTHPIDRIKTEMQRLALENHSKLSSSQNGIVAAVRSIFSSQGGFLGFYQGLVPRIVGIMPMRLVYWGTLNTMNDITSASNIQNPLYQYILPGMVAGAVQSIVDNPIEVFKTKLMTGAKHVTFNRNLYDGFTPLILRNMVFAIHVGMATKLFGKDHPFLSAALGGMIGSIVSQPLDVIKTEMQRYRKLPEAGTASSTVVAQPHSFLTIAKEVSQGGISRLFAGTTMRCTLGFANMGIGFMVLSHIRTFVTNALDGAPQ